MMFHNKLLQMIVRRMNDKVNFYRNWESYKDGFGNLHGNHWIG